MANFLNRNSKQYLRSVARDQLPEPIANYIEDTDGTLLAAVAGMPAKYWIITGDELTPMDQPARDAVDAAEETTRLDSISDELDQTQSILKAFAQVLVGELNSRADTVNGILDAIDNASNLAGLKTAIGQISNTPQRTLAQLKTAVRNEL